MPNSRQLLYVLVPALLIQTIGAYLYFIVFADSAAAPKIYGVTKAILFSLPLLLLALGYRFGPFLPKQHLVASTARGLAFGLGVAAAMFAVVAAFTPFFLGIAPQIIDALVTLGVQAHFIWFAIVLSLAHSLFEEYYWRWFVFGGLKTAMSVRMAAVIASVGFSAHHFIVISRFFPFWLTVICGLLIFIGGLFWCWLYHRYDNLWGNWLSHAILDAAIMAIAYQLIEIYTALGIR